MPNVKYDFRDAMKLLQTDEVLRNFAMFAEPWWAEARSPEKEFQEFQTQLTATELESLDPNGLCGGFG